MDQDPGEASRSAELRHVEGTRHAGHNSHRRTEGRSPSAWFKYRFEILWAIAVLMAILLLVPQSDVLANFLAWLGTALSALKAAVFPPPGAPRPIAKLTAPTLTLSQAAAYGLLVVAVCLMPLRLRWRARQVPEWTVTRCPRCGSQLHRIHRQTWDRFVSWLLPVHRYLCANRDCQWGGLRVVPLGQSTGSPKSRSGRR